MSKASLTFYACRHSPSDLARARQIRAEHGIPVSEQVRRGLSLWLKQPRIARVLNKRSVTKGRS